MIPAYRNPILTILVAVAVLTACAGSDSDLLPGFLPTDIDLENWSAVDTAQVFVGQDLFLMINGGAEVYHKYGFVQAATREYAGPQDIRINLEIYQMANAAAADSIYEYKTSDEGTPLTIGAEGRIEGYFLNFKKGQYVVTAVGFDSDSLTSDGLLKLTRATDAKLP
jgi:hypothetical protein